jgi:hypothetical protein
MRTWFRNFRRVCRARRPACRPVLERLESRCLHKAPLILQN